MNERSLADLFFQNTCFNNNLYDFSHVVESWPEALKLILNPEQIPFSGKKWKRQNTELISWIFNIKMVEWILLSNMESKLCTNFLCLKELWDWFMGSWGPPGQGQLQQAVSLSPRDLLPCSKLCWTFSPGRKMAKSSNAVA